MLYSWVGAWQAPRTRTPKECEDSNKASRVLNDPTLSVTDHEVGTFGIMELQGSDEARGDDVECPILLAGSSAHQLRSRFVD